MAMGEVFISSKAEKLVKTTLRSPKNLDPLSHFLWAVQWAELESPLGRFWPPDLLFESPVPEGLWNRKEKQETVSFPSINGT